MLTLTVSSKHYETPDDAAAALKRGLRLLRLRLKRHANLSNFSFLAVFEKHKSGYPHLHLLIRGKYIPWAKLAEWWEDITGSTHIDIRRIDSTGKAAWYVAKYIGKDLSSFASCKRWWRSHEYSADTPDEYVPVWAHIRPVKYEVDVNKLRFMMKLEGWLIEDEPGGTFRWRAPPEAMLTALDLAALAHGRANASLLRRQAWG